MDLKFCMEQANQNPHFAKHKDLEKVIIALGYLTQEQIKDLTREDVEIMQIDQETRLIFQMQMKMRKLILLLYTTMKKILPQQKMRKPC